MVICTILLIPLYFILQILIPIIQQIISTICNWVSTIITTFQTVWNYICSWLPWPINLLCKWVSTVITVIQTVWNYICNTIVTTIITVITYIIVLLIYIVHIICIVINIIIGLPSLILCRLGLSPNKKLRVCIKVLTDQNGNTAVTQLAINKSIERMKGSYAKCNIEVIILGIEYIVQPSYLATTNCNPSGILSSWHVWFTQQACWCCNQVTVYFVDQIQGASGCAYWGDNWCRVDQSANGDDTIMAHEVGHLLNLPHVNDPNNIMYSSYSPTAHSFKTTQCCIMRVSPYVTFF